MNIWKLVGHPFSNIYHVIARSMSSDIPRMRIVEDSFGSIEVPIASYYGAQTERSKRNFRISMERDRMPLKVVYALAMIKKVAAEINFKHRKLSEQQCEAISKACIDVYTGKMDNEFPLSVWQTGSGTQTNMNVNEVVALRASEYICGVKPEKFVIHPNDHVNCGQSSNDIFPTAMNVSVAIETSWRVIPALRSLKDALNEKATAFSNIVKIGRTHLQDAVPMTVGQELGAFVNQLEHAIKSIEQNLPFVCSLAVGGTAVGTGLNSAPNFDSEVCSHLTDLVAQLLQEIQLAAKDDIFKLIFTPASNKFAALAAHDALLQLSGSFNCVATILFKLANDFVLLSSGPSCGLGELILPPNEPGSSIMPGKVNPTQCESLRMVSLQVMGNHFTVTLAASQGQLQLNVFKPIVLLNMLHSCQLLTDGPLSFVANCVKGLCVNKERLDQYVENSLMLVTALSPHIGYDNAARLAKHAQQHHLSLREAAIQLQYVTAEKFDEWVRPEDMAFPFKNGSF